MTLEERMRRWLLRDLLVTPRGRAYVLHLAAEAKSAGERRLFDVLLEQVKDAALAKAIADHRRDEARHRAIFAACAARQGAKLPEIPPSLRLVDAIDRHVAAARHLPGDRPGFLDAPIRDARQVMEASLFLQVLEERAVDELRVLATALRPFDPRSAGLVREVEADERRHLRHCSALALRYAPTAFALEATLAELRHAEAVAYREHTQLTLEFLTAEGFIGSRAMTLFWRGVGTAAPLAELPLTQDGRAAQARADAPRAA